MNRVLRIQLRRSAAPGAALAILLVMLILHQEVAFLKNGWMPLAFELREELLFAWPLALAAGAWQARREHRAGVHDLLESTARPRWSRVLPVLAALGIAVSAAFLVAALTAVPHLIDPTSYLPATAFVVIAVGALSLMAAAWLGMALGQLLPSVVTAPALGVAGIGLLIATAMTHGDKEKLLVPFTPTFGPYYTFHDFFTVPGRVSAAQALWWLAVASTAMVILAGRSWARVAALLPALTLGAAAHIVAPQDSPYPGLAVDPGAQQLVCAEGAPRVCVARVHAHLLPEVTPLAREGLTMLARLPDAPTAAIENVNVREGPHDSRQKRTDLVEFEIVYNHSSNGKSFSAFDTLLNILDARGNHYSSCPGDVGADSHADRAAGYWLLGQEPERAEHISERVHELWRTLDALPDEEAVDRVTALRDAKRTCSAERAHLLTRGPA